jgi:hypothetical protein
MITVDQFLTVLREKDLVPNELLHSIYNQQAHHITAADVAQVLIDKGYLTPALANRLMGVDIEQSLRGLGESEEDIQQDVDIGFAPVKEEIEPRPKLGKHRPYKQGDSQKSSGSGEATQKILKRAEALPPPPPKPSLLDKPRPSRWASSTYDQEIDTSKGIVSPRLVKLAGVEEIPTTIFLRKRKNWLSILFRVGICIGFAVIFYLVISRIFFPQ